MTEHEKEVAKKNEEIRNSIAAKVKSKSFKVADSFGQSALFDIKTHSDLDYTAGGLLSPRWVKNDEGAIERRRIQGFYMPQELDANLKNISFGNLTLMLRTEENRLSHQDYLAKESDKVSGAIMAKSEIAKKDNHFVDFNTETQKKVIGAYK